MKIIWRQCYILLLLALGFSCPLSLLWALAVPAVTPWELEVMTEQASDKVISVSKAQGNKIRKVAESLLEKYKSYQQSEDKNHDLWQKNLKSLGFIEQKKKKTSKSQEVRYPNIDFYIFNHEDLNFLSISYTYNLTTDEIEFLVWDDKVSLAPIVDGFMKDLDSRLLEAGQGAEELDGSAKESPAEEKKIVVDHNALWERSKNAKLIVDEASSF